MAISLEPTRKLRFISMLQSDTQTHRGQQLCAVEVALPLLKTAAALSCRKSSRCIEGKLYLDVRFTIYELPFVAIANGET